MPPQTRFFISYRIVWNIQFILLIFAELGQLQTNQLIYMLCRRFCCVNWICNSFVCIWFKYADGVCYYSVIFMTSTNAQYAWNNSIWKKKGRSCFFVSTTFVRIVLKVYTLTIQIAQYVESQSQTRIKLNQIAFFWMLCKYATLLFSQSRINRK